MLKKLLYTFTCCAALIADAPPTPPTKDPLPPAATHNQVDPSPLNPDLQPTHHSLPESPPVDMPLDNYEGAFLKMFLTLLGLLVAIFFTIWLLKKFGQGRFGLSNQGKSIRILEKKPLSPKTMLYLIEIGNQQTLIAESQLEIKRVMDVENISNEPEGFA